MNQSDCPLCKEEMAIEQARIERLEYLFLRLARKEHFRIVSQDKDYERTHSALSFVTAIRPNTLELEADNGDIIAPLRINPAIAKLIQIDDGLVIDAKFHNGAWRLTRFEWMAHYETVEVDLDLSDEEFEKQQLEAEQEWQRRRDTNQHKNNGDCGLH